MTASKIRVLHCITSLDADGAQHMLLKLCQHMSHDTFEHVVVNLRGATPFADRFSELGVKVIHLGMQRAVPTFAAIRAIAAEIDRQRPDVLQGWMYHGNLAALAGRRWAKAKPPILWNIRKAVADISEYRPLTRLTLRAGAKLSRHAHGVIYCGGYISTQHLALGYSRQNAIVIPNGFDTDRFTPSAAAYQALRAELKVSEHALLVGMTARFHPHKDHNNFLSAAAVIASHFPNVEFVLAGRGVDRGNRLLQTRIAELNLTHKVHLLGERSSIELLLAGLDVYCQSSSAEGFPNALGEAMSCGVPCVTTDAGASAEAVGDVGIVVPVGDAEALASGVESLLALPADERRALGSEARSRICDRFSLSAIASQYEACYAWATEPQVAHEEVMYA